MIRGFGTAPALVAVVLAALVVATPASAATPVQVSIGTADALDSTVRSVPDAVSAGDVGRVGSAQLVPASCAGVKAQNPLATDGTFSISPAGLVGVLIPVYCAGMASSPLEYLTLPHTGNGVNFAQYTAGGASPGTSVVTRYSKIRFDPVPVSLLPLRFRVNIADQTFATSTGQLCHSSFASPCPAGQLITSMPYGVAFDCLGGGSTAGLANLDLGGTLFGVVDTFVSRTFPPGPGGDATFVTPQLVNVTGGGFCGWTAPADLFAPYNTNAGWDLRLNLLGL